MFNVACYLLVSGARGFSFWAIIVQYDPEIATTHSHSWEKGINILKILIIYKNIKF